MYIEQGILNKKDSQQNQDIFPDFAGNLQLLVDVGFYDGGQESTSGL